ncbi:MAG: sugar ABC transporter ATP-binding protein [Deltaproteobacteria bacterium]|nr:sugar ABC transporter ATP-binding protein [Deltaproteobacteria bacterium]
MQHDDYILEMRNVSKSFPGVKALDDVSVKIRAGSVHALMGENGAGKSTLMKCLFGIYRADEGQVLLEGRPVRFENTHQALTHGISMIHQELHPIPHRSVMENIWLGRYPVRNFGIIRLIDTRKMLRDTKKLFEDLKMDISPHSWAIDLSVSKIQSMEIAKAVSYKARVIIMDEPTSSLTGNEVSRLFEIIRKLKAEGVAIIYISHKMEEILEIADEVSIMRDGKLVGTYPAKELTIDLIINRMVGRDLTHRFPPKSNIPGDVIMRVEELSSSEYKSFDNISFELRRSEILGIAGLVGAKRTELVETLFGLRGRKAGKIFIKDKEVKISHPIQAKAHNIALLTEERRTTGIFPVLSVADNTLIANIGKYVGRFMILDKKRCEADVADSIEKLRVKTPTAATNIQNLSGGNQQKVIVARWLLTDPEILILDEPTRGIDVGAKYEIYSIIADLAARGKSIIMISSELPELLGMADRIMVMCEGRSTGVMDVKQATQERIMSLATQFM